MENKQIIIEELAKNEAFVKDFGAVKTPEDVKSVFSTYGVDVTLEEAAAIIDIANANELTEDALDNVSGGGVASNYMVSAMGAIGASFTYKATCLLLWIRTKW